MLPPLFMLCHPLNGCTESLKEFAQRRTLHGEAFNKIELTIPFETEEA